MKPETVDNQGSPATGQARADPPTAEPSASSVAADPPEGAPAEPHGSKRARRAYFVLGALVLAALLGIGLHAWLTRNEESTDDAQVEADVVHVGARVAGTIAEVRILDNTHVRAGDVIALLDTNDLEARLAQARAQLAMQQGQLRAAQASQAIVSATATGALTTARASVSGAQATVSGATDLVAQARAALTRAQSDAARTALDLEHDQRLAQSGAISQHTLDDARFANEGAQAAVEVARSAVAAAVEQRRSVGTQVSAAVGRLAQSEPVDAKVAAATAQAAIAEASVQQAEASLRLAELSLSYATIVAPVDGTVSSLRAVIGRIVAAGEPLAMIVPDQTYVVANFKETQVGQMRAGDRVTVELDTYSGRTFDGVVESLAAGTGARFSVLPASNATGNFVKVVQRVPVRVAWIRPPDVPLAAGLSAVVTVHLNGPTPGHPSFPADAAASTKVP